MTANNLADVLIRFFRESQRVILGLVDSFDQSFLGVVTHLAPVLAPIPAAYSIYRAMVTVGAPDRIALVTATAVELIGMFQSKTALRARNWNLIKLKSEPAAPFGLALTMAAVYFLTAFGLTLAIEFLPDKAHLVFPAFVVFAASVYVSNALASDLTRWEADRDDRLRGQQERSGLTYEVKKLTAQAAALQVGSATLAELKAELVAEQGALKAELDTPQTAEIARNVPLSVDDETKNQAHQFLLNAHHEGYEPTGAELGRFLGRSDSLGRRLKRELWPEITNGNGQLKKENV